MDLHQANKGRLLDSRLETIEIKKAINDNIIKALNDDLSSSLTVHQVAETR